MSKLFLDEALKKVQEYDNEILIDDILKAGKVIFTGVGKNAFIAAKTAATFSSLSIPAFHLDPTHALHGDFGAIRDDDVVISLSKSGNTEELVMMQKYMYYNIDCEAVWSINFNKSAKVNQYSSGYIVLPEVYELDPWDIVPTNSLIVLQHFLDHVAIHAAQAKGIMIKDFKLNHPGGTIGKLK